MSEWFGDNYWMVTIIFVAGALVTSFAAARFWPARPYQAAVLGGLTFEAVLLLIFRPGLSASAVLIAATCTIFLALIGGWLARHAEAQA